MGAAAVAAVATAVGLGVGLAGHGHGGSAAPRPHGFTLAQKHEIASELEDALDARNDLRYPDLWKHADRALSLSRTGGESQLSLYIRLAISSGCFGTQTEFHIRQALRLLREAPIVTV